MGKIRAVIFDLDDTLYMEEEYVRSGFRCVAKYLSQRVNESAEELFVELVTLFEENKLNVFNRLLNKYHLNKVKLIDKCLEVYRAHYPDIKLRVGAEELLKWLQYAGYKIGVITDGRPEGQWNKIQALNISKYCDHIIVTDELGGIEFRKPNEVCFTKMIELLRVKPEESVYIGDNPLKDFVSGNKLGFETIMIINERGIYKQFEMKPEYRPRVSISNFSELKKILWGNSVEK
jgi:Predicted hydrolase (HAD superfamily)